MKLNLPTWATTGLALLAGLASVLNQTTFAFVQPWKAALTVGLVLVAGLGIGPLTGQAFRAALHLSQNVSTLIAAVLAAATVATTTLTLSTPVHAILAGALTVLAGLGFGTVPVVPVAPAPAVPSRQ